MIIGRFETLLQEGIRPAVDGDENGADLADVAPESMEILAVVVTPHHDQDVAMLELGSKFGEVGRVHEEVGLTTNELESVLGEQFEFGSRPGLGRLVTDLECLEGLCIPVGDHSLAEPQLAVVDPDPLALFERLEDVLAHSVQKGDAGGGEQQRPDGGVPPGDRCSGIDHGGRSSLDQSFGGDAVDVQVVDHSHVAWLQPTDQLFGPAVDAGRAGNCGRRHESALSAAAASSSSAA